MSAPKALPPPIPTVHAEPAGIPFRTSAATSGPEVFGLLVTTLLLLTAATAVLWFARRRGWLDRWVGAAPAVAAPKQLVVLESLRINRQTTVHRVRDGRQVYLIAESTAQVQVIAVPPGDGGGA